ncbi:hypothetical protein DMH04_10740 [Kibdelosporangium aridum]|uniref:HPt domain-containing protein n=1 Tax=Kibdelosporangium aridum TaxID=2030 RepID=A0A428ZHD0_KIBAR|nr:hypothetical protein [Kibdelosporangium aridum]RSM87489.1 hypothetical protein DMH04_10740 [Kibdelosporangium aridum]
MNDQPVDPVSVLRDAIDAALPPLQLADDNADDNPAAADIEAALSTFARSVSPVLDQLAAMATAEPGGSVDAALKQLRRAFNHRGTGTISPTCRWQMQRAQIALNRHSQR